MTHRNSSSFRITSETSDNGIVEIRVKALYDYKAKEEDEIDLKKGQILTQMKPGDDQGWALGRLPDGTEGVYPSEYVTMV